MSRANASADAGREALEGGAPTPGSSAGEGAALAGSARELDEYRLLRRLGEGAMGEVWLAHDRLLDRYVAVKLVAARDPSPAAIARFFIEARAVARLSHPNVVAVHRVGTAAGRPYLVTELVRGTSLRELAKPMPWRQALALGVGLARGLAAAHRRGVLHRDVKPSNAMVGEDSEVKLLDFGLAKLLDAGDEPVAAPPPHGGDRVADERRPGAVDPIAATQPDDSGERTRTTQGPVASLAAGAIDAGSASPPAIVDPHATVPSAAQPVAVAAPSPRAQPVADALRVRTRAGAALGSPLYMAPEAWRGEPATPRTDVFSLGVVLYELCAGRTPLDGVSLAELPRRAQTDDAAPLPPEVDAAFAAIVHRCLARSAAERFASGDELREALEALVDRREARSTPQGNPYRGLSAFDADHSALFFGRDADVRAVLDRLRADAVVVVAADSGVGKSSLCRAGVLPALAGGALGVAPVVATCVPGRRPLAALAAALAPLVADDEGAVARALGDDPMELGRRLRREHREGVVVFVDQLEELVTAADADEAEVVARALAALVLVGRGIRLLAAVRGDAVGRVAALPELGDALARSLFFLRPLSPAGLRDAIALPAKAKGFRFETAAVVDALVDSAALGEGALPLLQFALAELWERRDVAEGVIPAAALAELGGVDGCLARHGDATLASLAPDTRDAARRVLLGLVSDAGTTAPRTGDELATSPAARAALEALVQARLVVARAAVADGQPTFALAHEALIARWGTLRDWLAGGAERRAAAARLDRAAAEWRRLGRSDEALWAAGQLADLDRTGADEPTPEQAEFLAASRRVAQRRRLRRIALAVLAPTLALLALAPLGKARYDRARTREAYLGVAVAAFDDARTRAAAARAARDAALARFDAGEQDPAEEAWSAAVRRLSEADSAYDQTARAYERVLDLDPRAADVRAKLGDVFVEHVELLRDAHREADAAAVLGQLERVDDGSRRAWLARTGSLDLVTRPTGARVELERYDANGRAAGAPEALGATPIDRRALAPGSSVLVVTAPGHATVRIAVLVGAGERIALDVAMPPAERIPDGFVYVPPGRFLYGSAQDDGLRRYFFHAPPLHAVTTGAYLVARHEVTFGQWIEFLRSLPPEQRRGRTPAQRQMQNGLALEEGPDGRYTLVLQPAKERYEAREGEPIRYRERDRRREQDWLRMPVAAVSPDDASAYLAWLDSTGRVPGARLCDDREWERAARGADARLFPGGDPPGVDDFDRDVTYARASGGFGPDEVGSHPASRSPFGVDDLSGNVWEWTRDRAIDAPPVNRGGCWYFDDLSAQIPNREPGTMDHADPLTGFRVCAPAP